MMTSRELNQFCLDVHKELTEMAKLGVRVPQAALDHALNRAEMAEYSDGSLSVTEAASLVLELN